MKEGQGGGGSSHGHKSTRLHTVKMHGWHTGSQSWGAVEGENLAEGLSEAGEGQPRTIKPGRIHTATGKAPADSVLI